MTDKTNDARFSELAQKKGDLTSFEKGELRAMRDTTSDPELRSACSWLLGDNAPGIATGGTYPILEEDNGPPVVVTINGSPGGTYPILEGE